MYKSNDGRGNSKCVSRGSVVSIGMSASELDRRERVLAGYTRFGLRRDDSVPLTEWETRMISLGATVKYNEKGTRVIWMN